MITKIRIERLKMGLRQVDLATQTGIPQQKISLLERGFPASEAEALKLGRALGLKMKEGGVHAQE